MQIRNNGGHRTLLTEAQRNVVRVAITETERHLENKYHLSELMPFVIQQKAAAEARERFWRALWDTMGLDRKARVRIVMLMLVIGILSIFVGPLHAAQLIIKWFSTGG